MDPRVATKSRVVDRQKNMNAIPAALHRTGHEDPITQHVNPVPLRAELGQNPPLTTGLPGLAGMRQGVARESRATPPEACGGAGGPAL